MKVEDCMCKSVVRVKPDATVCSVAKLMGDNHIGCVPVCEESGKIVGMVTDRDIILRTIACDKDAKQTPVSEIMTTEVIRTSPDTDIDYVCGIMSKNQIRRIPVVLDEKVVGIVTLGNIAQSHNVSEDTLCNTIECICHTKGNDIKNAE